MQVFLQIETVPESFENPKPMLRAIVSDFPEMQPIKYVAEYQKLPDLIRAIMITFIDEYITLLDCSKRIVPLGKDSMLKAAQKTIEYDLHEKADSLGQHFSL